MDDAREIAGRLSEAQKDALLSRYSWSSPWEQEEGERELYQIGIWGLQGGRSPLGLKVREVLQREQAQ